MQEKETTLICLCAVINATLIRSGDHLSGVWLEICVSEISWTIKTSDGELGAVGVRFPGRFEYLRLWIVVVESRVWMKQKGFEKGRIKFCFILIFDFWFLKSPYYRPPLKYKSDEFITIFVTIFLFSYYRECSHNDHPRLAGSNCAQFDYHRQQLDSLPGVYVGFFLSYIVCWKWELLTGAYVCVFIWQHENLLVNPSTCLDFFCFCMQRRTNFHHVCWKLEFTYLVTNYSSSVSMCVHFVARNLLLNPSTCLTTTFHRVNASSVFVCVWGQQFTMCAESWNSFTMPLL